MFALPDKTPDEVVTVTFDFTNEFPAGTTLSGQDVTIVVLAGSESPITLALDGSSVDGLTVLAQISAGVAGVTYSLLCDVDGSNGDHRQREASLRVSDDAAA